MVVFILLKKRVYCSEIKNIIMKKMDLKELFNNYYNKLPQACWFDFNIEKDSTILFDVSNVNPRHAPNLEHTILRVFLFEGDAIENSSRINYFSNGKTKKKKQHTPYIPGEKQLLVEILCTNKVELKKSINIFRSLIEKVKVCKNIKAIFETILDRDIKNTYKEEVLLFA